MKDAAALTLNNNPVAATAAGGSVSGAERKADMQGKGRYSRRLSPIERCSLVLNATCRYDVDGVVEGVGDINVPALRSAVARAAEANPAIRVRLRGVLGFSRWVDSGIAPEVKVITDSAWDASSSAHTEFMSTLDPARGGPAADILLVQCRDGRLRLVFRAVHAALDGRGMTYWICEVFRALRGEALQGSHSTVTDWDVQAKMRDQVTDTVPELGSCLPVVAPAENPGSLAYEWRRIILPHHVSQPLAKAAVFLAGWARRQGEGEVGFTLPVDYRGLRTQEMSIGNLTGFVQIAVGAGDSPRTVMQQLNQRIRGLADCRQQPIGFLAWLPLWLLVKLFLGRINALLYSVGKGIPSGGIVSMGLLKPENFSCAGFRAEYIHAIPGFVGKLNVVVVNFSSFTIVTFAAPKAYNHAGQLDEMIAAFRQHFMSGAAHQRGSTGS